MRPGDQIQADILEPEFLLAAYSSGYFPMADSRNGQIRWYSPDPRTIIPLDGLIISRSLKQTLRKQIFRIQINTAFEKVIRRCAERDDTWISEDIVKSYLKLFQFGFAHSVECWKNEILVGGLYGVSIGGAFFGESMFSRFRDASKVALVNLVQILNEKKFELLDTQFITPHLKSLGAIETPRLEYLNLLKKAIHKVRNFNK